MQLNASNSFTSALADFRQARQQAAIQEVLARFTGQSVELLAFDEVYKKLKPMGMAERGLKEIPLAAIVGSVNRYTDFTRSFLPRLDEDAHRWAKVKTLADDPGSAGLPPIQVYQIGEAYFVSDGNHRVSVARQMGSTMIEAYVTEVQTRAPLSASATPEEIILKAEYADFLDRTRLDVSCPGADFTVTAPGQYAKLQEQIETYQHCCSQKQPEPLSMADAAARWYAEVYQPVVQVIRDRGILRDFPGRTEIDLYLWVSAHRAELEAELGWQVRPEAATASLVAQSSGSPGGLLNVLADGPAPGLWRQTKIEDRYTDRLFADILTPLSGEADGWSALAQALVVAQRERSQIHGLHLVADEAQKESEAVRLIGEQFSRECEAAGVAGSLAVEVGEVAAGICNRALLNDLVILNLTHPPAAQPLARLGSGFRALIRHCARPVLAVPGSAASLERILLAYDGSPKAKEALFVAAYLAEQWQAFLAVVTVIESDSMKEAPAEMRQYLEIHEIEAAFLEIEKEPAPEAILKAARALKSELLVMGGYGATPMVEIVVGSSVDQLLREAEIPMLICR